MAIEAEFLSAAKVIKTKFSNVMKDIDKAVAYEEQQNLPDAIGTYEKALQDINEIFSIPVELPNDFEIVKKEWNETCEIIQNLKAAKVEISYRLNVLKGNFEAGNDVAEEVSENDEPSNKRKKAPGAATMYDVHPNNGRPKTYKEIIAGLRKVIASREAEVSFETLFQGNVKLYKIQPSGVVSAVAGETSMSLVMCNAGHQYSYLNGIYFIQCAIPVERIENCKLGDPCDSDENQLIWIYPLIPQVSNIYRTEYGAVILPDMESQTPGGAFGLMLSSVSADDQVGLSEEAFNDLQQFFIDLLEAVLNDKVELLHAPSSKPETTSSQVSKRIVNVADFVSKTLVKGAEKTGELMVRVTPHILTKMKPAGSEPAQVPASVQNSVEIAKKVTQVAAGVTGWVAGKVGSASVAVGRFLAPHIQSHGANILEKGFGYDASEASSKMEGALTIAAGAVEGFYTVYSGLETSAKILGKGLSDNSVKIIEYKYGKPAGNVAAGTFESLGNAFNVSQNVNYITPKGIAKKMAKTTGKAVVEDYQHHVRRDGARSVPAGLIYKDLQALQQAK